MKKITSLLAASAMLVGQIFNYAPVFATGSDEEGEYWYISETIDFRKTSKAEIAELCKDSGNYSNCFLREEIKRVNLYGYQYDAVWQTDQRFFTITAINPLRSTARVHYTGKNNQNDSFDAYITELYLYWIEDGKITPQLNYLLADTYTEQIKNGNPENGIHILYAEQSLNPDTPLFPTNEETRMVFQPGSNLMLSSEKQIYYTMVNNHGEKRSGFYNYSGCAFDEGLECKGAFYYKNSAYTYLFVPAEETAEDSALPLWEPEPEEPEPEPEPTYRIWTADELLELSNHLAEEERIVCGDDFECRWMLYDQHFMFDPELYQALEMITENNFLITSISPELGTLRIVYLKITPMMTRFGDTDWAPELQAMTLYWDESFRDDPYTYPEGLESLGDSTHLVVEQDFARLLDRNAFYGQEIEYQSASGNLMDDVWHQIYYGLWRDDGYDSWYINYDSCFAEGYSEGYECRLTIDQYGSMAYLPYEIRNDVVRIEDLMDVSSTDEDVIINPDIVDAKSDAVLEDSATDQTVDLTSLEFGKAPDSGFSTAESQKIKSQKAKTFPWWTAAVAFSAAAIIYLLSKPRQNQRFLKKVVKKS